MTPAVPILPTDPQAMAEVTRLARELWTVSEAVASAEKILKAAQERQRDLAERQLPEAMALADCEEFTLGNGWKLSCAQTIHTAITEARREEALAWLRTHGHEALIKRELTISFPRGNDLPVERLKDAVGETARLLGLDSLMSLVDKSTVHPGTLKAFVREQLAEGAALPFETFGVFQRRVASLQSPTTSKE